MAIEEYEQNIQGHINTIIQENPDSYADLLRAICGWACSDPDIIKRMSYGILGLELSE